jgi:hypothetical protein
VEFQPLCVRKHPTARRRQCPGGAPRGVPGGDEAGEELGGLGAREHGEAAQAHVHDRPDRPRVQPRRGAVVLPPQARGCRGGRGHGVQRPDGEHVAHGPLQVR